MKPTSCYETKTNNTPSSSKRGTTLLRGYQNALDYELTPVSTAWTINVTHALKQKSIRRIQNFRFARAIHRKETSL